MSTTTTGFVGPARYGPLDLEPDIITSLGEFKRVYGDGQQLRFGASGSPMHNFLWHAARAFFEEGGKRLYVVRVFRPRAGSDGVARSSIGAGPNGIQVRARFPGEAGNMRVRLTLRMGQSILGGGPSNPSVGALRDNDIVHITDVTSPIAIGSPPGSGTFYRAQSVFDAATQTQTWRFVSPSAGTLNLNQLTRIAISAWRPGRVVTATVRSFQQSG